MSSEPASKKAKTFKGMQIFVRCERIGTFTFHDINPEESVVAFKQRINDKIGMKWDMQNLYIGYTGKLMQDGLSLAVYNIQDMSTIRLEERLYGNGPYGKLIDLNDCSPGSEINAADKERNFKVLFEAAAHGHLGRLKAFTLDSWWEPNPFEAVKQTALHTAAANGHLHVLQHALSNDTLTLNGDGGGKRRHGAQLLALKDSHEALILHYAARCATNTTIIDSIATLTGADFGREATVAALEAPDKKGLAPMHYAANAGNFKAIIALHRGGASLVPTSKYKRTPAHSAAEALTTCTAPFFACTVLKTLLKLSAAEELFAKDDDGNTPAHLACQNCERASNLRQFLEVIGHSAAAPSLVVQNNDGRTPVALALRNGKLLSSGASVVTDILGAVQLSTDAEFMLICDKKGQTLVHAAIAGFIAAERASDIALPTEGESGGGGGGVGDGSPVLSITNTLKEIRKGMLQTIEPDLAALRAVQHPFKSSKVSEFMRSANNKMIKLLESHARLEHCDRPDKKKKAGQQSGPSPAQFLLESRPFMVNDNAALACVHECLEYFVDVGGMREVFKLLDANPALLLDKTTSYPHLLHNTRLLPVSIKQKWLQLLLTNVVKQKNPDNDFIRLYGVDRGNLIGDSIMRKLGINMFTGLMDLGEQAGALPGKVQVQFDGEPAFGDGLRREWFEAAAAMILNPDQGLFKKIEKSDQNDTLQPNQHSGLLYGAGHLSCFTLLGRIAGLALLHGETIPTPWSTAFIKAIFEYPIEISDLESADPDMYTGYVKHIQDGAYDSYFGSEITSIAELDLEFEVDDVDEYTDNTSAFAMEARKTPLKRDAGGNVIKVTEENKMEYLQLYVQHRLVGAVKKQIDAFKSGLGVFFTPAVLLEIHKTCTPIELRLLLGGVETIDVDEWEAGAAYAGTGMNKNHPLATWFWTIVRQLEPNAQGKILLFCTGSSRVPGAGIQALAGYGGERHRFTLSKAHHVHPALPTAATCFNTLYIPEYTSQVQLRERLLYALNNAAGFAEAE